MATVRKLPAAPTMRARTKVAAYARVSTDHERQVSSIAAQISHYSRLIQANPAWTYAGVFCDDGITGTSIKGRQGFTDLMNLARNGGVDLILTKSISRFARNTVDLLQAVRELKALGVAVRFERENIDTSTAQGEVLLTLLASFAQAESESNSKAVTWAIRKKYEQGRVHAHTNYGYTYDDGNMTIIEAEAEVVRIVFTQFLQGITPEATATWLNEHGYKPRYATSFNPSVLRKWLENEVYAGHILCQKHYRPKIGDNTTRPNDGHLPMYFVRNNHEPIIDQDTFDAVQAELGKRRATGGRGCTPTGGTGALTHKIICSVCGKKYHRRTRRRKTTSYKFWWCETATKGKGNPCQASQLRETGIQHACQQALGLDAWDENTVLETITSIIAAPNRELTIETRDGNQRTINLDDIDTMTGDNHG